MRRGCAAARLRLRRSSQASVGPLRFDLPPRDGMDWLDQAHALRRLQAATAPSPQRAYPSLGARRAGAIRWGVTFGWCAGWERRGAALGRMTRVGIYSLLSTIVEIWCPRFGGKELACCGARRAKRRSRVTRQSLVSRPVGWVGVADDRCCSLPGWNFADGARQWRDDVKASD